MVKIMDISMYQNELNILERAYLEVSGRENIINFMVNQGKKDTEEYKEFWLDYLHYLKAYNIIKNNFVNNCINKILEYSFRGTWQVDFEKKEVTLDELDN